MPKLSTEEFLDYLTRSNLVPTEQLAAAVSDLRREENTEKFKNSDVVALELVNHGLITNWHVRQLMKRKYKGFYLRQYRILGHLGTGGMSTVYLAEHTVMQRRVAIKVLPKKKLSNSAYLAHFVQEAQAIAALDHPNIVRAYDIDQLDDIHYIVMEYFEGENLRQLVEKEGPLAYEDAAGFVRQAALGLIHAHRVGVIHRDIKPENLLVNDFGVLKILDLGLAMLDESAIPNHSCSSVDEGSIIGTADYLAPEQAINSSKVDARADIYSLGATLYFCLTGHPPFPFGTISQRLLAHQREAPASIFRDRADAPEDLVRICGKMMEKKPENRFRSAAEVVRVFERWLIHHGVAEETDFPDSAGDESDLFTGQDLDSPPLLSFAQYGNVTGISDEPEAGHDRTTRSSDLEEHGIGLQNAVNLFDTRGSSITDDFFSHDYSSTGLRDDSEPHEEFLLSRTSSALHVSKHDVLDLAMNDLSRSRSRDRAKGPGPKSAKSPHDTKDHVAVEKEVAKSSHENSTGQLIHEMRRTLRWYRQVPVWFWAVFVAGYILATFLAGILFALLLNLNAN